mmetsp:Transcript_9489/g.34527  ORF Transcript_9489/g.34527 Transcript_9489/m.34527 type:complete len:329 (-) Transcript_9489:275-1261(-)
MSRLIVFPATSLAVYPQSRSHGSFTYRIVVPSMSVMIRASSDGCIASSIVNGIPLSSALLMISGGVDSRPDPDPPAPEPSSPLVVVSSSSLLPSSLLVVSVSFAAPFVVSRGRPPPPPGMLSRSPVVTTDHGAPVRSDVAVDKKTFLSVAVAAPEPDVPRVFPPPHVLSSPVVAAVAQLSGNSASMGVPFSIPTPCFSTYPTALLTMKFSDASLLYSSSRRFQFRCSKSHALLCSDFPSSSRDVSLDVARKYFLMISSRSIPTSARVSASRSCRAAWRLCPFPSSSLKTSCSAVIFLNLSSVSSRALTSCFILVRTSRYNRARFSVGI